jgi:hypothetical protein
MVYHRPHEFNSGQHDAPVMSHELSQLGMFRRRIRASRGESQLREAICEPSVSISPPGTILLVTNGVENKLDKVSGG